MPHHVAMSSLRVRRVGDFHSAERTLLGAPALPPVSLSLWRLYYGALCVGCGSRLGVFF